MGLRHPTAPAKKETAPSQSPERFLIYNAQFPLRSHLRRHLAPRPLARSAHRRHAHPIPATTHQPRDRVVTLLRDPHIPPTRQPRRVLSQLDHIRLKSTHHRVKSRIQRRIRITLRELETLHLRHLAHRRPSSTVAGIGEDERVVQACNLLLEFDPPKIDARIEVSHRLKHEAQSEVL